MIAETFLTVMNAAHGATKLYDWFTGVSVGDRLNQALAELERTKQKVERLSDHIIYAPNIQQAVSSERHTYLESAQRVVQLLDPLAKSTGSLLSTAVVSSPKRLKQAFERDPWEVLTDIRPINRAKAPSNPDLAPIVFSDGDQAYVGWQMKGALPQLFNCDFEEEVGLWVPKNTIPAARSSTSAQSSRPSEVAHPTSSGKSRSSSSPPTPPSRAAEADQPTEQSVSSSNSSVGAFAIFGIVAGAIAGPILSNDGSLLINILSGSVGGGLLGAFAGTVFDSN
ncbi:hypothetical protein BurJ1DRAFT_1929 [Burkholderiales bacterium JOSHI_001]|nr:hypothetical protein BurJ1DRAFT_1929 [Burkholderiales bacterium JOSHI_001]